MIGVIPARWSKRSSALNITRTPFDELNGNIQGFARGREIAVSPVAGLPHKTTNSFFVGLERVPSVDWSTEPTLPSEAKHFAERKAIYVPISAQPLSTRPQAQLQRPPCRTGVC